MKRAPHRKSARCSLRENWLHMSDTNINFESRPVTPVKKKWGQAGLLTAVVGYGAYAVLWSVMWLPVHTGGEGLLALYPLFILAWLPMELLVMVSVVLSIINLVLERSMLTITICTLLASAVFLFLSLPTLWFGEIPWYLFLP